MEDLYELEKEPELCLIYKKSNCEGCPQKHKDYCDGYVVLVKNDNILKRKNNTNEFLNSINEIKEKFKSIETQEHNYSYKLVTIDNNIFTYNPSLGRLYNSKWDKKYAYVKPKNIKNYFSYLNNKEIDNMESYEFFLKILDDVNKLFKTVDEVEKYKFSLTTKANIKYEYYPKNHKLISKYSDKETILNPKNFTKYFWKLKY